MVALAFVWACSVQDDELDAWFQDTSHLELRIDQAQVEEDYGFSGRQHAWQTFTPSAPALGQVDIDVQGGDGATEVAVSFGQDPSGSERQLVAALDPDVDGWISVPLEPPMVVEQGVPVYIVVTSVAGTFGWRGATDSDYVDGQADVEGSWTGFDYRFQAWGWVEPE